MVKEVQVALQQRLSAEKKLEKAEARIKYLEAELELLKKLEKLERQAKKRLLAPLEKYEVINEVIRKYQLKNMTSYLCELTGVSRSGYYEWLQNRETCDS